MMLAIFVVGIVWCIAGAAIIFLAFIQNESMRLSSSFPVLPKVWYRPKTISSDAKVYHAVKVIKNSDDDHGFLVIIPLSEVLPKPSDSILVYLPLCEYMVNTPWFFTVRYCETTLLLKEKTQERSEEVVIHIVGSLPPTNLKSN